MLPDPEKKTKADAVEVKSWLSRGYDFGANFTMNICAPVVETIEKVEGLDKELWRNVSAYYQKDGKTFSLG
jgi:cation-dependent mannose-6-phosphate receptor